MKVQLFAVLVIVAAAYALPRDSDVVVVADSSNGQIQKNIVENQVRNGIELFRMIIRSVGLDPVDVERRQIELYPVVSDYQIIAFFENLKFNGASDIRINALNYNPVLNKLHLDISLPEISLSIGDSAYEIYIVGKRIYSELLGSLIIKSTRLTCEADVEVGIGGISYRNLSVNFSLGAVESNLSLLFQEKDFSVNINNFFGAKIPSFFENNRDRVNGIVENIISKIFNLFWSF